jgi:rare lipoprotein A
MAQKYIVFIFFLLVWAFSYSQIKERGKASYYADKFQGRRTASGEIFDNNKLTAAHNTLEFNTMVRVTNVSNNKSVEVRINDRGPFVQGRIIDVSKSAAARIDMIAQGVVDVEIEVIEEDILADKGNQEQEISKKSLFEIDAHHFPAEGYGIQIGSFLTVENFLNEIDRLNNEGIGNTLVHVTRIGKDLYYRVIIGPYNRRNKAERELKTLEKRNRTGFIVDLKIL